MSPVRSGFCLQCYVAGALCALLLLSWASWPASAPDAKPLTAILLIGRDDLPDPDFADSIVLVMNNLGPAPVGIIINRPMPIPVSRLFPDLKRLATVPDKVYFGGPIDFGSVWFLFRAATPPEHAIQACDGVYLSADRQLLLHLLGRDKPMDSLRIFVGHAGWAPGQLEAEIERRDWTLKRAETEAIFSGKSEHPWPAPQASPQAPKRST
ncbi:MAG: YqgE/AlgH family protein [Steroidobacteraceae bacterium]